ncbi:LanC-like protein 3 [Eumeta japonica]|uniref:LanC-like protein 3 homolog n=1 Tax=Eumeta variegata TaxID=151549 RepID=A0A4C1X4J6_EUMVA|nr:LanC-like protein 3 [Eumeta japonica]
MVRHFPNSYQDYLEGSEIEIAKDIVNSHIAEHIANITKRLPPLRKNVDGGLYVGITGVAFMFYHLAKNNKLAENKPMYIAKALEYLEPALDASAGERTAFLIGDAGTYVVATALFNEINDERSSAVLRKYKSLYSTVLRPNFLKCGGDEYFVGRAGYLCGALWLNRELKKPIFSKKELYDICDVIIESGRKFSKQNNNPCPLMYHYYNTQYLGAAHGISTILQMLLNVPGYLEYNTGAAQDIKATVEFLASLQNEEGNWPCCMEEIGLNEHKLVHWCHGAPGTVYLMAKAFLVFKEQMYLNACVRAGEVIWNKGLLKKGPGICHGVAGNGYVFLLLYRLTGNQKYLYRAKAFADFMNTDVFLQDAKIPDNPESLYEGTAGTVCFLADLLIPDKAEFPFLDVFDN